MNVNGEKGEAGKIMSGLVSVVIPSYNHAHFLMQTLQSVIDQTYTNWEALVIDNHSEDNTDSVVNSFKDTRIKLLKINNGGVIAASRNLGIQHAQGEWVAFLDSDDYWKEDKLEICADFLNKNNQYVGICHSEDWSSKDNKFIKNYGPEKNFTFKRLLTKGNCISLSAMVVKKSIIVDVNNFSENTEFITAEDYDLWLKLSKRGHRIKFIKDLLGTFRIHELSESSNVEKNTAAVCSVIKKHCYNNIKQNKYLSNAYIIAGKISQLGNYKRNALRYYLKSIKHNPVQIKSLCMIISLIIPYNLLAILRNRIN